uniref:hypothetical protein n=1 Tax=Methylobacterium sp. B34 TaxID=95563 RepID=UPI000346BF65|nr:hypothetical protein [Methylobacterium sp. B34]
MRRTAEILTTLILFAVVMSALGWIVSASVPAVDAWLVERIGSMGIWIGLAALWITGGVLLYREKAGRAAGK